MKHNQLKLIVVLLFFGLNTLNAQEAIHASGGEASGTGLSGSEGSVSYSIGQVAYSTKAGSSTSIAEGVQQSYQVSVSTGIDNKREIDLLLSAYPNPTKNFLNLNVGNSDYEERSYYLYDMQGKLVENKLITSNNTKIVMRHLQASTYFLRIVTNQNAQEIKTFKITKN